MKLLHIKLKDIWYTVGFFSLFLPNHSCKNSAVYKKAYSKFVLKKKLIVRRQSLDNVLFSPISLTGKRGWKYSADL